MHTIIMNPEFYVPENAESHPTLARYTRQIRRSKWVGVLLVAAGWTSITGCSRPASPASPVVAEGILHTVSYTLGDGRVGGFTRLPHAQAVPGGNGSWNVDAYGKLTRDYLIVSYPHDKSDELNIIPHHCLLHVKFGDAGRKVIDSNPTPPEFQMP